MQSLKKVTKFESFFVFYIIMWFRFLWGHYFKFCNSFIVCVLAKLYCITTVGLNTYHLITVVDPATAVTYAADYYNTASVADTAGNVFISIITEEEYVIQFYRHFASNPLGPNCYVTHFMIILVLVAEALTLVTPEGMLIPYEALAYISRYMANFSGYLTTVYITDKYQTTVRTLYKSLRDDFMNKNFGDAQKTKQVKKFNNEFMKLLSAMNLTVKVMRTKMIVSYVCAFLRIMFLVYFMKTFPELDLSIIVPWSFEVILSTLIMFLPSVLLELAANYVDEIKLLFAEQLLTYEDKQLRGALRIGLNYLDTYEYAIWTEFPLNMGLVTDYCQFITNYAIALLQFSY